MSYLAALRLHFAGRFQAAPSTVNTIAQNFDSATFEKAFQQPGSSCALWNPRGNADFRLIGCAVTSAWHADGSAAAGDDPVRETLLADSDRQVAGKLAISTPSSSSYPESGASRCASATGTARRSCAVPSRPPPSSTSGAGRRAGAPARTSR